MPHAKVRLWTLQPVLGKRTILYVSPSADCFGVSLVLDDKAVAAARASDLSKSLLKDLAEARRYAEGTSIRLVVRKPGDLKAVRALVEIKLQN